MITDRSFHRASAMVRIALSPVAFMLMASAAAAQQLPATAAPKRVVGDTSVFAPLMLPAANEIRTGGGAPGARYWQNEAHYDIAAVLDTAAQTLTGRLRMRYVNNSPDTLRFIWMQMEQNAFARASADAASRAAT
jgi:hypothetical protein